jgi:hypothetical protein
MNVKANPVSSRHDLDRILAGPAFAIDEIACLSAARVLKQLAASKPALPNAEMGSNLLYRLSVSAICHQINWDYLASCLHRAFEDSAITASSLSSTSARDVEGWLSGYHRPERIRAAERAAMLRDIGDVIIKNYFGDTGRVLSDANGKLLGKNGFMAQLDGFAAFREDPLRKKSNVLVHELVRDGMARFDDESEIAPAIDYHIMRLYLRTGRVVPLHQTTHDLLKNDSSPRPRLVKLLRESVGEALSLTAFYATLTIPEVNGMEWQIGRDICDRKTPRCLGPVKADLPNFLADKDKCPNTEFCRAFSQPGWRSLREPDLKKRFY